MKILNLWRIYKLGKAALSLLLEYLRCKSAISDGGEKLTDTEKKYLHKKVLTFWETLLNVAIENKILDMKKNEYLSNN